MMMVASLVFRAIFSSFTATRGLQVLVDYAVFLISKGHRWSVGDFDGASATGDDDESVGVETAAAARAETHFNTDDAASVDTRFTDNNDSNSVLSSTPPRATTSTPAPASNNLLEFFEQVDISLEVVDSKLWFVDSSTSPAGAATASATVSADTTLHQRQSALPAVSTTVLLSFESLAVQLCAHDVRATEQSLSHAHLSVRLQQMALEVRACVRACVNERWLLCSCVCCFAKYDTRCLHCSTVVSFMDGAAFECFGVSTDTCR